MFYVTLIKHCIHTLDYLVVFFSILMCGLRYYPFSTYRNVFLFHFTVLRNQLLFVHITSLIKYYQLLRLLENLTLNLTLH